MLRSTSLLESDDSVSVFNFDCVPVTSVIAFDFVDKFAFGIQEFKLVDRIIVRSHLDFSNGSVFWKLKGVSEIFISPNLL